MSQITSLKQLANSRLYVAPANPTGNVLKQQLTQDKIHVTALLDNLKTGEGIVNSPDSLCISDAIVVASGPNQLAISKTLRKRGFKQAIYLQQAPGVTSVREFNSYKLLEFFKAQLAFVRNSAIRFLAASLPRTKVLYLASGFVDSNVLLLYQQHEKENPGEANALLLRATRNQKYFTNAEKFSVKSIWWLLTAKVIIIDHELEHPVFNQIRKIIPVVQLWHGLLYKKLAGNAHLEQVEDEVFNCSSTWFTENVFPDLFKAKKYYSYGFPRNDALLQSAEYRCFDASLPLSELQSLKASCDRFIVYMPTYRDDGQDEFPFSLAPLDSALEKANIKLILKLHPFVKLQVDYTVKGQSLSRVHGCQKILAFPSDKDIYPWLPDSAMLITDYSSVVFDYLVLDKPIVYFQYDREHYLKTRGAHNCVSEELFVAGERVETFEALLETIEEISVEKNDMYQESRRVLINKLGLVKEPAIPQLLDLIRNY